MLCFLVAHTSHWSQPLDDLLFALLKNAVAAQTARLAYLQAFTTDNLFSFIQIVLKAARGAFTPHNIKKSFKETGLYPFHPEILRDLIEKNHDPISDPNNPSSSSPSGSLVEKTTACLQRVLQEQRLGVEKQKKKVVRVKVSVKKCQGYDPHTMLKNHFERVEQKKKEDKEDAERKKIKEENRKRNREKDAKDKEERKRLRLENNKKREEKRREKEESKLALTCKAGCGSTCRTGPQWVGCDYCEIYWVCPACYKIPTVKGKLTKHENACKNQKNEKK